MGSIAGGVRAARAGGLTRAAAVAVVVALMPAAWAGPSPAAAAAPGGAHPALAGVISTIAGGVGGPGPAIKVAFGGPAGVSFRGGSMYVAERTAVRRVSLAAGYLTTPAGTGRFGPLGDGGPAAGASIQPSDAVVDHAGNLVIADFGNSRIRVTARTTGMFYGQPMTAGDIYTVAGGGSGGGASGIPATSATLREPEGVAVDGAGNLVIADTLHNKVRVVAARTGTFYGHAMTAGDIYAVAGTGRCGVLRRWRPGQPGTVV